MVESGKLGIIPGMNVGNGAVQSKGWLGAANWASCPEGMPEMAKEMVVAVLSVQLKG